ncbi:MAG: 50S ribosomal protein L23 [Arenicella sp.]
MNDARLYQVLVSPVVSEKSSVIAEQMGQVVFRVLPSATKAEVKAAVEKAFEVEVEKVQILNVKGKTKRFGRSEGKRNDVKKAYVRLKDGSDIDFTAFQA